MSVMDVRRLVRALGVGALVFLVLGGGIGLASAEGTTDDHPVLARPGPADRASYDVEDIILDRSIADLDLGLPTTTLDLEWLEPRDAVARDDTIRVAHPLASSFHLQVRGTTIDFDSENLFDAATGLPIGRTLAYRQTSGSPDVEVFGVEVAPGGQRVDEAVVTLLQGPLGPCGFRTTLQGRPIVLGDSVVVYGGCSLSTQETPQEHLYTVKEWTSIGGRAVVLLEHQTEGLRLYYDPSLPMPVRVEAGIPESMDQHFRVGRMFRLDLRTFYAGEGEYPLVAALPVGPAVVSPLVARTEWMVNDDALLHPFKLSEAYAIALDPGSYTTGADQTTVPEWLEDHDDAYLAAAFYSSGRDASNAEYQVWSLAWSDGDDFLSKNVTVYPTPGTSVLPSGLLPSSSRMTRVAEWDYDWGDDFFPPVRYLPRVPELDHVWTRAVPIVQARSGQLPESYGFITFCRDDCRAAGIEVFVGTGAGLVATPLDVLQSQSVTDVLFGVRDDGLSNRLVVARSDQQAPVPVLSPNEAPPEQPAEVVPSVAAIGWGVPSAKAATGVGLAALLASIAYYLWPTVKGLPMAGLFSRIEPDRVLEHPSRKTLLALVEANPGIHFQELARRSQFGRGQLEHHLRKLEQAELVSRVQSSSYTCFFARGTVDRRVMAAAPLLRSDGGRNILDALQAQPGATSRQIATQLGLSAGTVSYHVKRLRDAGLLESTGGALHLTETGRKASAVAA